MKIAVIEVDYHPEVLRSLLTLLNQPIYEVTVITTLKIWTKVDLPKEQYCNALFFLDDSPSITAIFNQQNITGTHSLILFNTLNSHYNELRKLDINIPTIVRVHNTNTFFCPISKNYSPKFSLFFIWKDLSHFVRKSIFELDFHYRKKILKQVSFFSFFSDEMTKHAVNKGYVSSKKIIHPFIPSAFHYAPLKPKVLNSGTTHISIIGSIDQRRRDYELVYKAIKNVIEQTSQPVHLHLLGKPNGTYGNKIIQKFESITNKTFKFSFFKEYIPQKTLEETLSYTDFLIIPIKEKTRHTIYTEFYGKTKISGSINDIIRYGLPALVPSFYPVDSDLSQATITYDNNHNSLSTQIEKWILDKEYKKIHQQSFFEKWNLEKTQSSLNKSLERFK